MIPRTIIKWMRSGRNKTTHCDEEGCKRATREGKPYCSEHVGRLPYVQALVEQIAEKEAEEAQVAKRGVRAVDPYGLTAREVLLTLWVNGERTVARLSRELNIDFETVKLYVRCLERNGFVNVEPTRRGAGVVSLADRIAFVKDPRELASLQDRPTQEGNQSAA